ncbi:DUF423 domain-containing protein [Methylococcus geothermalis]|uniref:DUF423 domain-containing protein n=1 Tax=Methylococcus geothermalis TaxID=2681310 RepID=A0A858Q6W1_9GAMM|nr:DUF423 domain-containing protein [Methylococcus geothermalis]QJD29543.1 DUF423 domain-containing protein [Methylococcus geothermalis]
MKKSGTNGWLVATGIAGFTGVAMGAFGAHGLKAVIAPEMLAVYQTGVQYHVWHALGLGLVTLLRRQAPPSRPLAWAAWLMLAGIVLFSGSLYLLAVSGIRWLGMITPFGGMAFLAAWACVSVHGWRQP